MSYPCRLTSLHSFVPIPCTYRTTTADNEREKQIIYWAMHVSQESMARRLSFSRLSLIKAGQHVYFCSQVHNNVSRITDTLAIKVDLMTRGGGKGWSWWTRDKTEMAAEQMEEIKPIWLWWRWSREKGRCQVALVSTFMKCDWLRGKLETLLGLTVGHQVTAYMQSISPVTPVNLLGTLSSNMVE